MITKIPSNLYISHLKTGDSSDKLKGDRNFLFFPSLVSVMAPSH